MAAILVLCVGGADPAGAGTVINVPNDQPTIQDGLDAAFAGDVVEVETGTYNEKVEFPRSGTALDPIILRAKTGHSPAIDGTGQAGDDIVLIDTKSHVRVIGFEIKNNLGVTDGSGIRLIGSGAGIELRDNVIHELRGSNAMGITVYATDPDPFEDLIIDNNEIYDAEPSPSEALVLNGNVTGFEVTDNYVHDVNNIGIDFIGGETDIQPNSTLVARNGLCRGNIVLRCGSGYSGGIYVDGGKDITIENNIVSACDLGIEVAAENAGILTENVTVRNNVLYENRVVGLVFGGFKASVGRANNNVFRGNTLYKNATDASDGEGEIWVQYGDNNVLEHNLVHARGASDGGVANMMVVSYNDTSGNALDYNLYFSEDGAANAEFSLENGSYAGFAAWQASGQDANSLFADPQLDDPGNGGFHIADVSPARDAGDPSFVPDPTEIDLDGEYRLAGSTVDIGADEVSDCGDGSVDPGEECDDANTTNGDGCDNNCTSTACGNGIATTPEECDDGNTADDDGCDGNCTVTACGNGVVTAGEQCDDGNATDGDDCDNNCTATGCANGIVTAGEECDDGNTADGDCCDSSCQAETVGSSCSDGEPCTLGDECDGGGLCVGSADPDPACLLPLDSRGSSLLLKDKGQKDLLKWSWGKGPQVDAGDFGLPATTDDYTLCVYEDVGSTPGMVIGATAPAGGSWTDMGTRGFKYKSSELTPDGIKIVGLKPGTVGRARIKVKGKGTNLGMGSLGFDAGAAIIVQMRNQRTEACFGAQFGPPFMRNDVGQFKDRTD